MINKKRKIDLAILYVDRGFCKRSEKDSKRKQELKDIAIIVLLYI